jgi:hypothetical protein
MKQGASGLNGPYVLVEMYNPTNTNMSTANPCIDIFTIFQTAMISGATHRAKPVVLNPMTSEFPLTGRYTYLDITAAVHITLQIVRSSCETVNLV